MVGGGADHHTRGRMCSPSQDRRTPSGAAQMLLRVAALHPKQSLKPQPESLAPQGDIG